MTFRIIRKRRNVSENNFHGIALGESLEPSLRTRILFLPGSQRYGIAEIFLFGGDAAAAFADEFRIPNKMRILVGAVLMHAFAVKFT